MRQTFIIAILFLSLAEARAQDTTRRKQVTVTSAFKPVLKEAAKINFGATPPTADTAKPRLQYSIPAQNLQFAYQPGTLKPLALSIDTGGVWDTWNYAKIGYGTLKTPYLETGLSLGDGKNAGLNVYGKHISSKGKIENQDFGYTAVELNGFVRTGQNTELSGRFGVKDEQYKKYGYVPSTLVFDKDSLKLNYATMSGRLALRNIARTEFGISYAPEVKVDIFTGYPNNRETNGYINLPVRKSLTERFEAEIALEGAFTNYNPSSKNDSKSNYFTIAPSLFVKTTGLYLQAGIKPTWENGSFKLFPNVMGELSSSDKKLTLMAGWIGHVRINSYQSLAEYNPWIWAPNTITNSRIEEVYAGLKGAVTDHFNYMVKAGVNKYTNQPLFLNDTVAGGKSFMVMYEPDMKSINVHGELGYTVGDKFSLKTGLTLNKYAGVDVADKPWGLLPLEFNTTIRLQVLKDLYFKSDLYAFSAPWYRTKAAGSGKLPGALDLNAGLEFAIVKNVKLWAQFNNILNNSYERWKQYPVYGFNFLGGVVFSLAQNKK
ncbi:MAG: hypothetical protein JWP88_623 [Flaviaesturariibacter sp.]|nr:hypothetical protein [Flaviaesturariibacter sp.]